MTPVETVRAALALSPEAALTELTQFPPTTDLALLKARALRLLGRHDEALAAFDEAESLATDPLQSARTRIGKIDSLGMLGRYDEALSLGEEAISRLEALGADGDAARARCNVGSLYWRLDRYDEALARYEAAAATFESQKDMLALAVAATNRANALACLGRVEEGLPLHEQARDVYTGRGMEVEAAEVETNIGYLHHISGRHTAALAALARARKVFLRKRQCASGSPRRFRSGGSLSGTEPLGGSPALHPGGSGDIYSPPPAR
ncbi:MAG: tetratricopeptide repeat protein [Armatimonas sp.]